MAAHGLDEQTIRSMGEATQEPHRRQTKLRNSSASRASPREAT